VPATVRQARSPAGIPAGEGISTRQHRIPALPRTILSSTFHLVVEEVAVTDSWQTQREALGAFIRSQRKMANLSLRQLADLTSLSNPYLSQVERGLHEPSVRVLKAISDALNVSAETLLAQAGLVDAVAGRSTDAAAETPQEEDRTEDAIAADKRLSDDQRAALLAVYRSMVDRILAPAWQRHRNPGRRLLPIVSTTWMLSTASRGL
jgi:transcriptional regulator with XRE-family HTH domain